MSSKDDVFNYVMNSPEDTNPSVLRSLLNGIVEGVVINDDTPSTSTVYSSSKVESLIPANELPEVSASDFGKYLTVKKSSNGSYKWGKEAYGARLRGSIVSDGNSGYKFALDATGEYANDSEIMNVIVSRAPVFCCTSNNDGIPAIVLTGACDVGANKLIFSGMYRKETSTVFVSFEHSIMWTNVNNDPVTVKEIADPA